MISFREEFTEIFTSLRLEKYTEGDFPERFETLYERLVETNKVMNLTALTEQRQVILGHFADSLMAQGKIKEGARVIDVGCGGGFPTLPLAIARPDISITALDSTAKKLTFVSDMAKLFGLKVETLPMRAEDASKMPEYREKFDVCVSRAVARLNILDEICLPFVKKGGIFVAMKGADAKIEYDEAEKGIKLLGGQLENFEKIEIEELGARALIVVKKVENTSQKYPRAYAKIKKTPL
ncbi:MAG: 16S rRNA (guanine(527)-N(7))-methyltransferase RsmG [Clostridia bacterium]|nr:16S rRNA (guanine(527)-N(7))-methyltransferase RsmG [Clostridia bacterium]